MTRGIIRNVMNRIEILSSVKMKVFVTGGSGFVGLEVVPVLVSSGYEVIALARSDDSTDKLNSFGSKVKVIRGDLKNLDVLKKGTAELDGVIHLGFIHDFTNFDESSRIDRAAIEAMLSVLVGTNKPFIGTSAVLFSKNGKVVTEEDPTEFESVGSNIRLETENVILNYKNIRSETENVVSCYKNKGVRSMTVRLAPTVHGKNDKAFIPILIKIAQKKGTSGYIGDGKNVWPAVNVADAATLYKLAFEKGKSGRSYHGVAEQGVETKEIALAIGELLKVPVASVPTEKAFGHFGPLTMFWGIDKLSSNKITREELEWEPTYIKLLQDIKENYGTTK